MAPLQGHTLGQRQKFYNILVKEAVKKNYQEIPKINYDDNDVDNMINTDIACTKRNVVYILEVFKCEDMLYVSRAINKSTWLITDLQYAHIINPKYLHRELFPQMNAKAVTKLILHIRRYLKDEIRCKAFFNYISEKNKKSAFHWLQNCSLQFIKTVVSKYSTDIPFKLLVRLCKKSISILRVLVHSTEIHTSLLYAIFNKTLFYIKSSATAEEFLDIIEKSYEDEETRHYMKFNERYTHILMKRHHQRIKNRFEKYLYYIDLTTFVKCLNRDEIIPFIIKYWKYTNSFETLTLFLSKLPRAQMLENLQFLYNIQADSDNNEISEVLQLEHKSFAEALFYAFEYKIYDNKKISIQNICRWYRHVEFNVAFDDIKKFIHAESSSQIRNSMLIVLLSCARYDLEHVKTVLHYYNEKHINEPFVHKISFVNSLISQQDTFKFDDSSWNIFNDLLHSLGVYSDSSRNVQDCLPPIIVYNVLRGRQVPELIEEKFSSETLKGIKNKLNTQEQDKLFDYLYNLSLKNICKQNTNSETGMHNGIELLKSLWNMIKYWNKTETHHQFLVNKIAEFGVINDSSPWVADILNDRRKRRKKKSKPYGNSGTYSRVRRQPYINIPSIYNMMNTYRKELFENSVVLHACEDVCLNALKHDPLLLVRYIDNINRLRCDDEVSLKRFLCKLRTYWPDTLAAQWTETNIQYLQKGKGHRALVRGILYLLPHQKVLNFIEMYKPNKKKIQWNNYNKNELSIQKHIAKNIHIVRPQLPANVVLWYAQGDYLQHAVLSLHSLYFNLRSSDFHSYIEILLNAPVSLQKHGIRLAFAKLKTAEIINKSPIIWQRTKNASIRSVLFKLLIGLLCNENKPMTIKAVWTVLSLFIDDLNHEENRSIYKTLGNQISNVPASVVGEYYQKAYLFLKSLPDEVDWCNLHRLIKYTVHCIEYLDCQFVENNILGSIYYLISQRNNEALDIFAAYLLCSKSSEISVEKYNKLIRPVINRCISKWSKDKEMNIKTGLDELLSHICKKIPHFVFEKNMVMPVQLIENIQIALYRGLLPCITEHYVTLTRWQLTTAYIKELNTIRKDVNQSYSWEYIRHISTRQLADICAQILTIDSEEWFPSIYILFIPALEPVMNNFLMNYDNLIKLLEHLLECSETESVYLFALNYINEYPDDVHKFKIENMKKKIYCHSSEEVKMHYFAKFNNKYKLDCQKKTTLSIPDKRSIPHKNKMCNIV